MPGEYEVYILHPETGEPLVLADHYEELDYVKRTNAVGQFMLQLSAETFDIAMAHKDGRLVVWRRPQDGARGIDFAGLIRSTKRQYLNKKHSIILRGPSYNDVLTTRIVPYDAGTAEALKNQEADDLQKALVRENLGASAVADRDIVTPGYLSVQPDVTGGTVVWKNACRRKLLTVLQEVSQSSMSTLSTGVFFGVVPINTGFEMQFRTNVQQWGLDHRHPGGVGPQIFALERGNMADPELDHDAREEITYVYAAGEGEETNRLVVPVYDTLRMGESPLNRREVLFDGRQYHAIPTLASAGRTKLEEGRPLRKFSFSIVETPSSRYGTHWGHGDFVTGSYEGEQYDLHVAAVQVTIEGQKETIRSRLEYMGTD